ncbi:DUF4178 domain-containing protein [Puniceicoccus vermicola]|uniref:DUF4178 domain-containing protein n=1 Tax=Puniceicoccus vermicola TaxID=388746 RepID=A0A7X1B0H5_9BACT|nr:DUF4178 domain-containing protein [Puniceicoccus vermicola]MBC2603370.1 DUF4178 domain-containing protein [Puniceicoccus vermicola]
MFFLILFVIAAAVLFYFYRRNRDGAESSRSGVSGNENRPLTIQNVRSGGVIQLEGVGEGLEDFDVVVKSRHLYEEDGFVWYELEGEKGIDPVWIEIEEDDELELSICLNKLKLSEIGVTGSDINEIGDQGKGFIDFDGMKFIFEESGKARFFRNGDRSSGGEKFRYWDFETKDGMRYLSVERWGAEEYVAYISEPLRLGQIKIFSLS